MSLFQAEKLIDLACSTTHEEEARTAALAACRLIRKQGMRLTLGATQRGQAARPKPQHTVREKPPNGGVFQRATRWGRCGSCGGEISAGDSVYVVDDVTWCARH